jgi:hypothetical protein
MIRYTLQNQMSIEEFKTPFQVRLDKNNRWVKLGESIPWDALASIYYRSMSSDMGAPAIDARIVIGAMTRQIILRSEKKEEAAEGMSFPPKMIYSPIPKVHETHLSHIDFNCVC